MVNLATNSIHLNGMVYTIARFECWWTVPGKGLYTSLQLALMESTTVYPTPVAIGPGTIYEVLPPEVQIESPSNG
jgi:hypothetical protein